MKELEDRHQDKEQAIVAQHKTLKLVAQQAFIPGLLLWSLNVKTREIKQAEIIGRKVIVKPRPRSFPPFLPFNEKEVTYDVESNPDLVFVQALNKRNAARKFGKEKL